MMLSLLPAFAMAQQNAFESPAGTRFLLYTPPGYDASSGDFPLLISLHGKGEWGTDLTKLSSGNPTGMPSRLIHLNQWPKEYNFIVLTPQYNPPDVDDPNPVWPASHINEVLDYVLANWRIEGERIYVTGLSFGANATWNFAAEYPHKVAAIVPISGRADFTKACLVKNIPAWVFHSDGDETVTPAYSRDMIQAIDNCTPAGTFNRKLDILFTKNHEGWNEIYNGTSGYKIYDWLLMHSLGSSSNPPPYVNAGPDMIVHDQVGQVTLTADAFDSNGSISEVSWKQISGTPLNLSNAGSRDLTIGALEPGSFEFEFAATDDEGSRASDKVVVTVSEAGSLSEVSDLILIDGATNNDLMVLSDGIVVNKELLGTNQFNIRARTSANTKSVRFSVNTFRNARTVNQPNPYLIKVPQAMRPEWQFDPGEYTVCATPFGELSGRGEQGIAKCISFRVIEGAPSAACEGAGVIYRELWPGVEGVKVSDTPFGTHPAIVSPLYQFEAPTGERGAGDNYGSRIRGYLCPPVTGKYTFWIASDEQSELWLSTDDSPGKKQRIAYVNESTNSREWNKYSSQRSVEIPLVAETRYYVEALHKEATLNDHLAVGWTLPDGTHQRPIPGIRLIRYTESTNPEEPEEVDDPDEEVVLYPNPLGSIESVIKLRGFARQNVRPVKAVVISPNGQIIRSIVWNCLGDCDNMEVNLANPLPPGVYSLHVITETRRIPKRFIVN